MATYTANYGLHQWVPDDNFLRTDFNTDFQKIDAGIKAALSTAQGKAEIVTGTYTGDGTQNRLINLGFQPRGVLVETRSGHRGSNTQILAGLALPGAPLYSTQAGGVIDPPALDVTANGFHLSSYGQLNTSGEIYRYLAVK